jgi:hypothetical protein
VWPVATSYTSKNTPGCRVLSACEPMSSDVLDEMVCVLLVGALLATCLLVSRRCVGFEGALPGEKDLAIDRARAQKTDVVVGGALVSEIVDESNVCRCDGACA